MVNYDYLYDKEYFREQIEDKHFVDKTLTYRAYENAYIVPYKGLDSGVYTNKGEYVKQSNLYGDGGGISFPRKNF